MQVSELPRTVRAVSIPNLSGIRVALFGVGWQNRQFRIHKSRAAAVFIEAIITAGLEYAAFTIPFVHLLNALPTCSSCTSHGKKGITKGISKLKKQKKESRSCERNPFV